MQIREENRAENLKNFSLEEVNDLFRSKENLIYLFQLNGSINKAILCLQKKMAFMLFLRSVIAGKKRLHRVKNAVAIPKIPKYGKIDVRKLWSEIKDDNTFAEFFPETYLKGNYVPDRTYFFTVA